MVWANLLRMRVIGECARGIVGGSAAPRRTPPRHRRRRRPAVRGLSTRGFAAARPAVGLGARTLACRARARCGGKERPAAYFLAMPGGAGTVGHGRFADRPNPPRQGVEPRRPPHRRQESGVPDHSVAVGADRRDVAGPTSSASPRRQPGEALAYPARRRQYGRPRAGVQGLRSMPAGMPTRIEAGRASYGHRAADRHRRRSTARRIRLPGGPPGRARYARSRGRPDSGGCQEAAHQVRRGVIARMLVGPEPQSRAAGAWASSAWARSA